jgi:hypothetical protein
VLRPGTAAAAGDVVVGGGATAEHALLLAHYRAKRVDGIVVTDSRERGVSIIDASRVD